uniref:Uncharacterized protein n=1 Tax=Rhizophora mucronata TaxID=61149 RepID=A0A2P2PYY9_RHIMU
MEHGPVNTFVHCLTASKVLFLLLCLLSLFQVFERLSTNWSYSV